MTSAFEAERPAPSSDDRSRNARSTLLVLAFLPLVALFVWQATRAYWLCDDAFISFRYVRNLVDGHGLVFNRGERVEGYTNFLWVLELAAIWKVLGVRPETSCAWLSVLYTAGSLVLTVVFALSGPFRGERVRDDPGRDERVQDDRGRDRRAFVAFGALLLLAASHTWAVWTTSGLETRQFTFFVVLAVTCLVASKGRPRLLVVASLALAAGEYTRPESLLLFGCCGAWLVFDRLRTKSLRFGELVAFAAPFAVLVLLHFAWRWSYYHEIWPNTYYAKHVRPWPEAGIRYFGAAACEFGLYLLFPAALVGAFARLRRGDAAHLCWLACVLPHVAYIVQIGGDHFEYRVLDFYWPFLAVAALEGIVAIAGAIPRAISRPGAHTFARDAAAAALLLVLLLYTSGVQVAKELATSALDTRAETQKMKVQVRREHLPALFFLPGMPALLAAYNGWNAYLAPRGIAAPWVEHRFFWRQEIAGFAPYEVLAGTGRLPPDAVTSRGSIGVSGYYLPDLVIIDAKGLTDWHVARQPVSRPNEQRYMAHDRSADWPYLDQRGFNIVLQHATRDAESALEQANYALRVADGVWMPFDTLHPAWAEKAFRGGPEVRTWRVDQVIGCFSEGDVAGWTLEGTAFVNQPRAESTVRARMHPYRRCPGAMELDSRGSDPNGAATGEAFSPTFRVRPGARLEFWLGGPKHPGCGVRLLRGHEVLEQWRSRAPNTIVPERLTLSRFEGEELRLCVFDESADPKGYVRAADVVLLVPAVLDGP